MIIGRNSQGIPLFGSKLKLFPIQDKDSLILFWLFRYRFWLSLIHDKDNFTHTKPPFGFVWY